MFLRDMDNRVLTRYG